MVWSLKNKIVLAGSLLVVSIVLSNCSQSEKKDKTITSATNDTMVCSQKKPLNPNGDSELALLMRKMNTETASFKELIKQGKLPDKFPEEFLKIHTAKPTDSSTNTAVFQSFATNYTTGLNTLFKSPKGELTQNYNAFVQGCVDCHHAFCPGPIKAINKLKI